MLEKIFQSEWILREHREGPLSKYSDELAAKLIAEGHAVYDLKHRFGIISDLNRWISAQGLSLAELNPEKVAKFIKYRKKRHHHTFYRGCAHAMLQAQLKILRSHGVIPQEVETSKWDKKIEDAVIPFIKHLQEEKGFSISARNRYKTCACQLISACCTTKDLSLAILTPDKITQFIIQYGKNYRPKTTQLMASAIRTFLRFLFVNGDINRDLSSCIPSIPGWRGQHLPEFLEPAQVMSLLKSCDRRTKKGIRNYALLLLIVRLGLRASEVLHLSLDDINWTKGTLLIRGKGPKQSELPLPQDIGEALVAYVQKVRPQCKSRSLFLRARAPYRGLNHPSSISTIVCRALIAAKLSTKRKGAHLLRYTAATTCLRQGATLPEVGELLRHRSIDTTAIYAKVDLTRLTELAQPWPGA